MLIPITIVLFILILLIAVLSCIFFPFLNKKKILKFWSNVVLKIHGITYSIHSGNNKINDTNIVISNHINGYSDVVLFCAIFDDYAHISNIMGHLPLIRYFHNQILSGLDISNGNIVSSVQKYINRSVT